MKLALKVDVDTYRGTREGVPRLAELLRKYGAGASFFFSLGPDHTGRAIKRVFRPGFMSKVSRTSVLEHYGAATLLYGTLLPGPDIGARCAGVMREVRDQGFHVGIHCWDHVKWQDGVAAADAKWTEAQMQLAATRFEQVLGEAAKAHAAAGWQTNVHALRLSQRLGLAFCSDTRGTCPFVPVWNAEPMACPQIPTTLPTLDELAGLNGVTRENVAQTVLKASENPRPSGHVFTLHAELEGGKFLPQFEQLLAGWKSLGYEFVSLMEVGTALNTSMLPRHEVVFGSVPGRSGTLAVQGKEFLT